MDHVRLSPYPQSPDMRASEEEQKLPEEWLEHSLRRLTQSLSDFTSLIEDRSHRVDEWQAQSLADNVTTVQTFPDYEFDAIIESVVITGPTATPAFTLQLGRRYWNLTLPASGILVISPISITLSRDSTRQLTSATAGNWTLELMGYADTRYRYK